MRKTVSLMAASVIGAAALTAMPSLLNCDNLSSFSASAYYDTGADWNIDENGTLTVDSSYEDCRLQYTTQDIDVDVYAYEIDSENHVYSVPGTYENFSTAPWYEYTLEQEWDIAGLDYYQLPVLKYEFSDVVIGENISYISDYSFYNPGDSGRVIGGDPVSKTLKTVTIKNPDCEIESSNAIRTKTICGYDGSTAQTYAEQNGLEFVSLGEIPHEIEVELSDGTLLKVLNKNGRYIITGCDANAVSVHIPESIDGIPVTKIAEKAFKDCTLLEEIVLPDSITEIGDYAFSNCTSLKSIEIPDSVTSMGGGIFYSCTSLEKCRLPESMTSLAESVDYSYDSQGNPMYYRVYGFFQNCPKLTSVVLPENVVTIGKNAFMDCESLTSVNIPDSVQSIGNSAFSDCGIESIHIPDGVAEIENCCFQRSALKSIILPYSVATIESGAFNMCKNLEKITILNPECEIKGDAPTICNFYETLTNEVNGQLLMTDVYNYSGVICGYDNSTAESYARNSLMYIDFSTLGDVNNDGKFSLVDLVIMQRYMLNNDSLANADAANLTNDDIIDSFDVVMMRKMLFNSQES